MTTLRLRSIGHGRKSVEESIHACALAIREKQIGRKWQRYAAKTADYAFGMAGDRICRRMGDIGICGGVDGGEEKAREVKGVKMR